MTLTQETVEYTSDVVSEIDLEIDVAGLSAIEILDEFLRRNPDRGMFSRREVVDLLLDIRLVLQKSLDTE